MDLDFRSEAELMGATTRRPQSRHGGDVMCVDCQFSDVFAVEPRALCRCPAGSRQGRALFAGQPACEDFVGRSGPDLRLGVFLILREPARVGVEADVVQ